MGHSVQRSGTTSVSSLYNDSVPTKRGTIALLPHEYAYQVVVQQVNIFIREALPLG